MPDKTVKLLLAGILVCLAIIAFKPADNNVIQAPTPNLSIDNEDKFLQIAPNLIGVKDSGQN